jgi:hypothetical protein
VQRGLSRPRRGSRNRNRRWRSVLSADGNQRLKSLLNARVRASGPAVEKHDPMDLKMPVGVQMVVRVEGGYKQITIETLEKVLAVKRRPA